MTNDTTLEYHPEYSMMINQIAELSPDKYYQNVFRHPMDFWRERLEMIGGQGFDRVLDAGHGFGQWSIVLAEHSKVVKAVDHNKPRCDISQILKNHYDATNMDIMCNPLSELETLFEPGSFDLIFCWGVIMFVDRQVVMSAFNRLLADRGILILGSVNTPGRWQYKFDQGIAAGRDNPKFYEKCKQGIDGLDREIGVNSFSLDGSGPIADRYGFEIEHVDYDGCIDLVSDRTRPYQLMEKQEHQNIELVMRKVRAV